MIMQSAKSEEDVRAGIHADDDSGEQGDADGFQINHQPNNEASRFQNLSFIKA